MGTIIKFSDYRLQKKLCQVTFGTSRASLLVLDFFQLNSLTRFIMKLVQVSQTFCMLFWKGIVSLLGSINCSGRGLGSMVGVRNNMFPFVFCPGVRSSVFLFVFYPPCLPPETMLYISIHSWGSETGLFG